MKFLCPSCKAKYQIADEKVAGRSVRMKCRKCGYVIQVSSVAGLGDALPGSDPPPAGIDALSDVSAAPPPVDAPLDFELSMSEAPPPPVALIPVKAPAASAPTASAPQRPEVKKPALAPVARPSVPKPTGSPLAPVAKAPLPAPKAPPPAKSSPQKPGTAPARPAPAAPSSALKSEKLTMQGGVGSPGVNDAVKAALAAVSKPAPTISSLPDFDPEDESTRIADAGALAGAFSLAVGGAVESAAADSPSMPADEWFVGINGVPVGPIRLSELRSKAASGSVNRESLVWRDGFEDWRPLKTFPELVAIVDESVSSARASLTPFTPAVGTALGTSPSGDPIIVPGAAAATAPTSAATAAAGEAFGGSGVTGTAVVTDDLEAAGVPKRSGTSPAAWIAVAIALLFGLTIGFVLFSKAGASKTIEVVKYVDRPVPGAPSGAAAAPDVTVGSTDPAAPDNKDQVKHATGGVAKPATSASTAATSEGISGLKGLSGLSSLGPSRGPDGTSGPSGTVSGTGQLDGAQIQSTVARYTGSVKRACWQPALDTRDKDAPTTARVNVAITVLPSGSVSNAAVGGDPKGYRGLSQCISSRVRGWQFPPSGDTTTVNVPFVFAAQ
jgi:predicted Zn finger-like uncharacterized protein